VDRGEPELTAEELAEKARQLAIADADDIRKVVEEMDRQYERDSAAYEAFVMEAAALMVETIRKHSP
jgi:glutamyl-tRNA reductase